MGWKHNDVECVACGCDGYDGYPYLPAAGCGTCTRGPSSIEVNGFVADFNVNFSSSLTWRAAGTLPGPNAGLPILNHPGGYWSELSYRPSGGPSVDEPVAPNYYAILCVPISGVPTLAFYQYFLADPFQDNHLQWFRRHLRSWGTGPPCKPFVRLNGSPGRTSGGFPDTTFDYLNAMGAGEGGGTDLASLGESFDLLHPGGLEWA